MGERRKRKSMWHMEDENKQFSQGDHNSWAGKERHSISNRGRDHDFRGSRDFIEPKSRDRPGRPSHELNEENIYYQNMSPGLDGIERRRYKHCPEDDRGDYHRYPRKDRSRSHSRSRSPRGRARSGSPRQDYKNQCHKWSDQRSENDRQFQICRDFSSGRCRKGSQCRFDHSRNTSRGHSSKDSYSKVSGSDLQDDVHNFYQGEEGQFRKKSRNAVPCREFMKGWCKWGDSCRFSHHLSSNETTDIGNPGDNSNSRYGNRSSLRMENEDTGWRTQELGDIGMTESIDKENMANKQEGYNMSHGFPPRNEVGNVTVQEHPTLLDHGGVENGIVTSFGSDVLNDVKSSSDPGRPFSFSGQNQSGESALPPGQFSVSNTSDVWQNMPIGGLDGFEKQAGARMDLHSQVPHHQLEMQSGGLLDLHSQLKNHQFETHSGTHLDLHSQVKNHLPETHSVAHLDLHSHLKNYQLETQSGAYFDLHSQVKNHIPETQSGACLDLHSQVKNHEFEKQSGGHLDLHSQVKNHMPETRSGSHLDLHSQAKNHELETQSGAHLDLYSQVKNHIPETQSGSRLDLHSQVKNHELETQSVAHLDFHPQVKNHLPEAQSEARLDLQSQVPQSQVPNHQRAVQILTGLLESKVTFPVGFPCEPINLVENVTAASKHENYTEQYNQIPTKPTSPLPTICKGPDIPKVDDSENSKQKQEAPLANPEADEGNKAVEEIKGVENNKKSEENLASKEEKAMRLFKNSLIEFVKDILKPTWKEGRLSREVHKTIVKKVVDKVTSTVQPDHVPKTPDKIGQYLSSSKPKIAKLVQAYVERSQKTDS